MVAVSLKQFSGMSPITDPRLLKDESAAEAVNLDLSSGVLDGLRFPVVEHVFGATYERAYRLPKWGSTESLWFGLTDRFASVARSPLANDTERRVYWTYPNTVLPQWSTYDRLAAGDPPYTLGTIHPPEDTALIVNVSGGTGSAPEVTRSYCWTWVNEYGEESRPNLPSDAVSGPPDADWLILGIQTGIPGNPTGYNYPAITRVHLYRTLTGTTSGGAFFLLATFDYDGVANPVPPITYHDTTPDEDIVSNQILESDTWGNPPNYLDGLMVLPGGMMVGFTGNTVHFTVPNRPHAWPAAYDISVHYDIVGMAWWRQSLVVVTKGYPSMGTGTTPATFTFTQIHAAAPCISRGSIVSDLSGVYYATNNGLVQLTQGQVQNITSLIFDPTDWLYNYHALRIYACRHKNHYLALLLDPPDETFLGGWMVDFSPRHQGVVRIENFAGVTAIWNDDDTGETFAMAGDTVYRWDAGNILYERLCWKWRSKNLFRNWPNNFGACQVMSDPSIELALGGAMSPDLTPPGDLSTLLPDGVNATISIIANPGLSHAPDEPPIANRIFTKNLRKRQEIFRLPSGYLAFDWQIEIISRVPVFSIELASTMHNLRAVPYDIGDPQGKAGTRTPSGGKDNAV